MISDGAFKLASVYIVEWLAEGPWLLEVVNLEAAIWWYPGLISLAS